MTEQIEPITLTSEQLIKRFAEVQQVSEDEARQMVGADSADEILKNIENFTKKKIEQKQPPMNRKQRRALLKKLGRKKYNEMMQNQTAAIAETTEKLNYIDLIQKLRVLNEQKEKENEEYDSSTEDNRSIQG